LTRVAESFTWPFRGAWKSKWVIGIVLLLFLPVTFIPVLGYSIAAIRAALDDPVLGPPPWRWSMRLFWDGWLTASAILLVTAPFVLAYRPLLDRAPGSGSVVSAALVLFALALPWGCVLLLLMPHCSARLAVSGRWKDVFDFAGALRRVAQRFPDWNAAVAAIVTAWAIGLACVAVLCAGVVPGVFYAILVSAHATAAFHRASSTSPAR
jgi:hypothetical protein